MLEALVLERIALADRHLRDAEGRIAVQRWRVTNYVGEEKEKAAARLNDLLQSLDQIRIHRVHLNEELRLCRISYYAL